MTHEHIKTPYLLVWVAAICFIVWVDLHYQSTLATLFTIGTVALPLVIVNSMFGTKDDPEGD